MHVVEMQRVFVEREVDALDAAMLAGFPRQVVLDVVPNRQPAQDDIAEQGSAKMARRRHDPSHTERRAKFSGLSWLERACADHFLKRDDVGVNGGENRRNSFDAGPAIEAASAVNVVSGDAYLARPLRGICHQSRSKPRNGFVTGSFFASF